MTGSEKIFFDTVTFIYLVENHPKYYLPVANFIVDQSIERESLFYTSVISVAEFFVKPKQSNNINLLADLKRLSVN